MRRHHRRIQQNHGEYFYIRNISDIQDDLILYDGHNVYNADIQYSFDMTNWTTIPMSTFISGAIIEINPNQKIYLRGEGERTARSKGDWIFAMNHQEFEVGGYLSSLFKSSQCFNDNTLPDREAICLEMFSETRVIRANNLIFPSNVTERCYESMFRNCSKLEETPVILPAGKLSVKCYIGMFRNCTNIVEAPILPAEYLISRCYDHMFQDCTNLRYIECHSLDDMTTSYCSRWLYGTSGEGVFIKDANATWTSQNASYGVPVGWTIFNGDPYTCPFYIENRSNNLNRIIFSCNGSQKNFKYSTDLSSWNAMTGIDVKVPVGGRVYIKSTTSQNGSFDYYCSQSSGEFAIGGNILSLLDDAYAFYSGTNLDYPYLASQAFGIGNYPTFQSGYLKSAIGLFFPTNVSAYCYWNMFQSSGLIYPPHKLPAETLDGGCYKGMFNHCGYLVAIPKLPAKTVYTDTYREMFSYCGSLKWAKIYAETIDGDSMIGMFAGCVSLEWINAPILSADSSHTNGFTQGVSNSGAFIKNAEATWSTTGDSGVPNGWSTVMRYV